MAYVFNFGVGSTCGNGVISYVCAYTLMLLENRILGHLMRNLWKTAGGLHQRPQAMDPGMWLNMANVKSPSIIENRAYEKLILDYKRYSHKFLLVTQKHAAIFVWKNNSKFFAVRLGPWWTILWGWVAMILSLRCMLQIPPENGMINTQAPLSDFISEHIS